MKCLICGEENIGHTASFWRRAKFSFTNNSPVSNGHYTETNLSVYEKPIRETVGICKDCFRKEKQGRKILQILVAILSFLVCISLSTWLVLRFASFSTLGIAILIIFSLLVLGSFITSLMTIKSLKNPDILKFLISIRKRDVEYTYLIKQPELTGETKFMIGSKSGTWFIDFWTEEEFEQIRNMHEQYWPESNRVIADRIMADFNKAGVEPKVPV